MQQADVRIGALDDFAVELEHQAQHAVRRRMLRAKVHRVIANLAMTSLTLARSRVHLDAS